MGKRKRRVHRHPIAPLTSPDPAPCSSGIDPLSTEKPPVHNSSRIEQPHLSTEDIMGSHEQQNEQFSMFNQHQHHHHNNPGRSMYLKRSRNRGHHYPRHHPGNHSSTYQAKNNPSLDNQTPFKVGNSRWNGESGFNTDGRERAFIKQERIRSTDKPVEIIPWEDEKRVCGTCERLLRQKQPLGSPLHSSGSEVVAVLVCGHFFHAGCLEQRTKAEEASDPPCPFCFSHS